MSIINEVVARVFEIHDDGMPRQEFGHKMEAIDEYLSVTIYGKNKWYRRCTMNNAISNSIRDL